MKWRKLGIYFGCLFSLVFIFSFCYYLSYESALSDFNSKSVEQNNELVAYLKEITSDKSQVSAGTKDSTQVDTTREAKVVPETVYKLQIYDMKSNTTTTEVLNPPSKFIGLSREELITLLADEMQNVSLEEYQKGLVSFVLISFSEEEIVLRKSYNPDLIQFKYYLAIYDGKVIVYYSDKKTIYEYTGIEAIELSEKIQAELSLGKYVKDEEELYSILEGYSS